MIQITRGSQIFVVGRTEPLIISTCNEVYGRALIQTASKSYFWGMILHLNQRIGIHFLKAVKWHLKGGDLN